MELVSQYILQISIFIASTFTILIVIFKRKATTSCVIKLPPGRKKWPFLGETLEFIMAGRNGEPEKFVNERTRLYSSNVFKTSLLGQDVVFFCGDSGNKFLLSTGNKNFKLWVPKSLEIAYLTEDERVQLYSHSLGFFKLEALQHYVPIVDLEAKEHLETYWLPHKQVKTHQLMKNLTFALSSRFFMNITDPDEIIGLQEPFIDIIAGIISIPINFPGTPYRLALQAAKTIQERIELIINKRKLELSKSKSTYSHDMLSCLLRMPSPMSENAISRAIIGMLFASHDTISSAITFTIKYLAENQQVYEKVLEEQMEIAKLKSPEGLLNWNDIQKMEYSWCVARESMRLAPPAQGNFKEARNDITYEGFTIPKGWKAYWTVHSTNTNPAYFTEPTKFDPSRFEGENHIKPYSYLPFGAGPQMCKGQEYARLVILVFLHNLVTKFQWQIVIKDEKIIKLAPSTPANGLPIRIQPRVT